MLHGRAVECAVVQDLLDDARAGRSAVLVVRGDAGVGKSALLEYAAERADGMRVLRGFGVDSEAELAFAGLHQIMRPGLDYIDALPTPQAEALASAFGIVPGARADRFLISVAVLSVLSELAEERPVLCLVDDAQWLDQPSADALVFAARRLESDGVAMLFAAREEEPRSFHAPGLDDLHLGALDDKAARELLEKHLEVAVAPDVRDKLVVAARGVPLVLLELPSLLTEEQLVGEVSLPDPLPLSTDLRQAFLERVRRLPEATQTLLLLAAADTADDLGTVMRAAALLGIDESAVDAAVAASLVRVVGQRVEFHHPLVRSAVYDASGFTERRQVHHALAEVLEHEREPDRRAWHLAAAVVGHDAAIAAELEGVADRARLRSGYATASRALERSAELSEDDDSRAVRLVRAADDAWLAGTPDRALALLDAAAAGESPGRLRADIVHLRGTIELRCGMPAKALRILAAGAEEVAAIDTGKAIDMLVEAGQSASYAGDVPQIVEMGRRAKSLVERGDLDETFTVDVLVGIGLMLSGETDRAAPLLNEAISLAERFEDPRRLVHAGASAGYLGLERVEHELLSRAVEKARTTGAVSSLPYALEFLAQAEVVAGRYAAATTHASEGLRLARETGQGNSVCHLLALLALTTAIQGLEEECRSYAAEALERSSARGLGFQTALADWALARLDLGMGRPDEALGRLAAIAGAGPGAGHPFVKALAAPDLIEAAVRTERPDGAMAALVRLEQFNHAMSPPWALALAARCRALLSTGATSEHHFEEALRLHAESDRTFDRARTELLYGELLRRTGRRKEGRGHFRAALEAFERLRATPWEERARRELRASGERARVRDPSKIDQLTAQELQVAQFVATGMTNKEIAAQLFLSPRTIDSHLRKIFTKLGISSRAELIRLELETDAPPEAAERVGV
jgi:DNA-binding NarL/FixJ family response regulator/tetratricopeptide (TPR) repeat protein